MRRTIAVMAESTFAGCPHERILPDALARASAVPDAEVVLAYPPPEIVPSFRGRCPDIRLILQDDIRQEDRIAACFERLSEPGKAVLVMRADVPMPARYLELAFDALSSGGVDVVLGPIAGGGCYLVGMKAAHPEPVTGMDWDAEDAVNGSVERAAVAGLDWYLLPVMEPQSTDYPQMTNHRSVITDH